MISNRLTYYSTRYEKPIDDAILHHRLRYRLWPDPSLRSEAMLALNSLIPRLDGPDPPRCPASYICICIRNHLSRKHLARYRIGPPKRGLKQVTLPEEYDVPCRPATDYDAPARALSNVWDHCVGDDTDIVRCRIAGESIRGTGRSLGRSPDYVQSRLVALYHRLPTTAQDAIARTGRLIRELDIFNRRRKM